MPKILVVVGLFLLSFSTYAQISTPERTKFNIGVYGGLSVWKYRPMVSVDFSYKGTTLRLMPNYNYYSAGITQDLTKLSPVFYNLYWTASLYGGYGFEYGNHAAYAEDNVKTTIYTGILSTGIKTYFAKRMYTHIMGGVMYNQNQTPGYATTSEVHPYFEFGLGLQFFKTYPVLKREETAE